MSRYAVATLLIVALSPGHSDITRFSKWSPIATGNRLVASRCRNMLFDTHHDMHFNKLFFLGHTLIVRKFTVCVISNDSVTSFN